MKGKNSLQWIEEGYKIVAVNGFNSLSIEVLARNIGKNKSSFYHYFGDMQLFEEALFDHHLNATQKFGEAANKCSSLKPEVINLMVALKDDMFFHKQLRINRNRPECKACFDKSFEYFQAAVFDKWVDFLGLNNQRYLASAFFNLASENLLLRMTYDTYTYEWLINYLKEFTDMMKNINKTA